MLSLNTLLLHLPDRVAGFQFDNLNILKVSDPVVGSALEKSIVLNTSPGKKLHWLPISERIKYKVACMCFSAISGSGPSYTSLNCCMSTLRLVHYALILTPACWKSNTTNARLMAFAPSLALDPTFGIHSHKTLDTAQPCHLLKPN